MKWYQTCVAAQATANTEEMFFLHFCCYCTLKIKCWIVSLIEFPVLFIWIFCKSSPNKDLILIGMTRNDPFILLIFLTHAHVLINRQSWFLCVLLPKYSMEKARLLVFAPINNLFVFLCAEIGLIISLITVLNGINFCLEASRLSVPCRKIRSESVSCAKQITSRFQNETESWLN